MYYDIFRKNVRRYRLIKSLTQNAFVKTINCFVGYIGRIEHVKSKHVLGTDIDLSNALDVMVDEILVVIYLKPEMVYFKEISDNI